MQIWEFKAYRPYLNARLSEGGPRSGKRTELAAAIQVHTTFVSQVLKGRAELSLEQADGINLFLSHSEDESEYFLTLVLQDRAGTKRLRTRFEDKINKMRETRQNIGKRLQAESEISEKDRERFYSSAVYGATHVLCSLPHLQDPTALAAALRLPLSRVTEILDFLLRIGLLQQDRGRYSPGTRHVHLNNQSELILKHHINWRLHCVSALQFLDRDDLHYSGCMSLSREDAFRVKEAILEALSRTVKIVETTTVEEAYVLGLDFYKLS
jgi:uncharacterized protein (TIGR02147 family)